MRRWWSSSAPTRWCRATRSSTTSARFRTSATTTRARFVTSASTSSEGGAAIATDRRLEVESDVVRLEGRVGKLEIQTIEPGAEILIDDVVVGLSPLKSADPRQQRPAKGGGGRPQRRASHPPGRRRRRRGRARELLASRVAAGGASPVTAPRRRPVAAAAATAAAAAAAAAATQAAAPAMVSAVSTHATPRAKLPLEVVDADRVAGGRRRRHRRGGLDQQERARQPALDVPVRPRRDRLLHPPDERLRAGHRRAADRHRDHDRRLALPHRYRDAH